MHVRPLGRFPAHMQLSWKFTLCPQGAKDPQKSIGQVVGAEVVLVVLVVVLVVVVVVPHRSVDTLQG